MGYKAVGSLEPARPKSGTRSRSRTPSPTPTPTKPKISEAEKRRGINYYNHLTNCALWQKK